MYKIVYLLTCLSANEIYTKLPNLGVDAEAVTEQTKVLEEEESKLEQMEKRILEALRKSDQEIEEARFYSMLKFTGIIFLITICCSAIVFMEHTMKDLSSLKSVLAEVKNAADLATNVMTKLRDELANANCSLTGLSELGKEIDTLRKRLDGLERSVARDGT